MSKPRVIPSNLAPIWVHKNQEKKVNTNIQETLDRLRELDQKASPAPWWVNDTECLHYGILSEDIDYTALVIDAYCGGERIDRDTPDLKIIVEARNAIPKLIAEIERRSTNLSIANARLGRVASNHPDAYLDSL